MKITLDLNAAQIAVMKQALSDYIRYMESAYVSLYPVDDCPLTLPQLRQASTNALIIDSRLERAITLAIESGSF